MMNTKETIDLYRRKLEILKQELISKDKKENDNTAIIGINAYLPGAMSIEEFWEYLDNDASVISVIPPDRFDWREYYSENKKDQNKMRTKWGGFIPNIKMFDPQFFGILPSEAKLMDPQHKLLMMSVYSAIEDAGYASDLLRKKKIGVYVGIEDNEYLQYLQANRIDLGMNGLNHHPSMAANRISYFFDFHGPSQIINTMCSSTSTAMYYAKKALESGDIEMAIVCGARIILNPNALIGLSKMNIVSSTPTVLSFGENADGYIRSEGVVSIVLKLQSKAQRDKDHIYACVKNIAINYNGKGGSSIAAPNKESHVDVIKKCYANIDPRSIEYIEAQGMGNQVADIIEWESFNKALKELYHEQKIDYVPGSCKVSTIKPMIGHMECVSSLGALLKIIRSFKTNKIHKILDLDKINPSLTLENMPCELLYNTIAWERKDGPRLAGLHSYGSGGNNAHLLIEEYNDDNEIQTYNQADKLIILSAISNEQLCVMVANLCQHIMKNKNINLEDLAYTLQVGRNQYQYRAAFIANNIEKLIELLDKYIKNETDNSKVFKGKVNSKEIVVYPEEKIQQLDLEEMAALWVGERNINWAHFHKNNNHHKISLPTLPFAIKECWAIPDKSKICIIGAGPSGLVMAKSLLEEGHIPEVYEEKSTIGGLWNLNTTQEKKCGAYQSTRFQSSRFTSVFSDFYPAKIKSDFYSVQDVIEYLDLYAKEFNLYHHINLNSKVVRVKEQGNKWEVVIQKNGVEITKLYDGVAMCQGSFTDPFIPSKQGLSEYKGEVIHSGQYFNNEIFKNKRVLIIGNGVSAMDIADEASDVANEVLWSKRSNKLILPRMVGFVPNDCQSPASLMVEENRSNIIERLKYSMPEYFKIYQHSGILPDSDEFKANPIVHINDGVIKKVADKKITVKKDIDHFTENGCVFLEDNKCEHTIDLVVFCTGYKNTGDNDTRYEYLKNIKVLDDFAMGIFYERNPTLVNTSVLPIAYTGSFYFMEMVARWYAQLLSGKCKLTDDEKQQRISPDHYLIMAPISSVIFGIRLGLFPDPKVDFKKFWQFLNYPAFPMICRLIGPHAHAGAADMLKEFSHKSYVKTDINDEKLKIVKYRILAGLDNENLRNLLSRSEINEEEFEQALKYKHDPIILNWELQYIKKPNPSNMHDKKIVASSNNIESDIAKIVSDVLIMDYKEINTDKHLSEYGFDSITLTSLSSEISNKFKSIQLEPSVFLEYTTIKRLSEYIRQKTSSGAHESKNSFNLLKKGTGDVRTFWFHAAFGTIQVYNPLAKLMSADVSFYAMDSQASKKAGKSSTSISEMSEIYTSILLDNFDDSHFHLGGYSQGGVIAYEVARNLQQIGKEVSSIVMIDTPFPPIMTYITQELYYKLIIYDILNINNKVDFSDMDLYMYSTDANEIDLSHLVSLCAKYNIPYTHEQIKNTLKVYQEVLSSNSLSMENHIVKPLIYPNKINCHYFKRQYKDKYFKQDFFDNKNISMQNAFYKRNNCAERWINLLPKINLHKTTCKDHFSFFNDEEVLSQIVDVCNNEYGA